MGVYIKDMEMPKSCHECETLTFQRYGYYGELQTLWCKLMHMENVKAYYRERHPNCPLVEVPEPHGSLIDVDDCDVRRGDYSTYSDYSTAFDMIDNAPIVIEAESE